MLPAWRGERVDDRPMFWEHEGNSAVRLGRWKLVRRYGRPWELYDLVADRTELTDLAGSHPGRVASMAEEYEVWAERCGVIPRERILDLYQQRGRGLPPE
jgi:arylsulfatase A-like enzyme